MKLFYISQKLHRFVNVLVKGCIFEFLYESNDKYYEVQFMRSCVFLYHINSLGNGDQGTDP